MTRMKELRKQHKEKQEDIASFLGVTRGAYANIENGKRETDNAALIKLAEHFNVTVDYLLGRDIKDTGVSIPTSGSEPPLTEDEQLLIQIYRQMNQEGQEKMLDYADDLARSGKYIKHHETPLVYQKTG